MANAGVVTQSPEGMPKKPEEQKTPEEQAMEQIKHLEMERAERGALGSGMPGKMGDKPPPKQQKDDSSQQDQPQQAGTSQVFSQLTSAGYKPSDKALQNAANQAHTGPVDLSRTWLANLFIRVLRASKD